MSKHPSVFLYEAGEAKYEERAVPAIEDSHDVFICVSYVGVCGSDVSGPKCNETVYMFET
jgi:D-xylulose reductase